MDMKKMSKIFALILAIIMMCLCLSGCDELDEMRKEQAFWLESGNADSLIYNGEIYKKIEGTNLPDPLYNCSYEEQVYVTDPDVPVLLSQSYGEWLDISEDHNFMYGYIYGPYETEYYGVYESGTESLYCKDDMYDAVSSKIASGIEYTLYGYGYYTYDEEDDFYGKFNYYYLKNDEIKAINKVIEEVKPTEDDMINYNYEYLLTFDKVSDDKLFGKYSYELYYNNFDGYYLADYSEALGISTYYKVPDSLTKTFDKIASYCRDSDVYTTQTYSS